MGEKGNEAKPEALWDGDRLVDGTGGPMIADQGGGGGGTKQLSQCRSCGAYGGYPCPSCGDDGKGTRSRSRTCSACGSPLGMSGPCSVCGAENADRPTGEIYDA